MGIRWIHGLAVLWCLALTSALQAQTLVASGTYPVNGHLYEVYNASNFTWADAQAFAVSRGGYLATITDDGENTFVGNLNARAGQSQRWLGGFQPPNERNPLANWQWVTGEPWVYTNWGPSEPNDYSGPGSEQYLGIGRLPSLPLTWNDTVGTPHPAIGGFIVEYVPEPASVAALSSGLMALIALRRRRK